jgi:hypothetical protein
MGRPAVLLAACLLGLLAGCAGPTASGPPSVEDPNLHVHVSNQSFEQPTADLLVTVDGLVLFDGEAEVEQQHNWMLREAAVASGSHVLEALERGTGTKGSKAFTVPPGEHRWVVVDYWTGDGGERPHFTISVHDEPVAFA